MFMTAARSAPCDRPDGYTAPTEMQSVTLRELLYSAKRGPQWNTHQLDIFKGEAVEPDEQTLFCAGDLGLVSKPCVSIVGSREATTEGHARAGRLARELVAAGVVVVSGLAKGIDATAHVNAIENRGRTIAVIGTPLSKASPVENGPLQEAVWREHLLISPFPEGKPVYRSNFPQRNKVMAALSDATVIVEASDNSGTLHQAIACQDLGRWLFILKAVVDVQAWPKRFLSGQNTVILERTDQILDALALR
jgi:DNA processing protein